MKKEIDWFKERGYLHLTNKISVREKSRIENYISDPKKVSAHKFSPLIYKEIVQRRYKKVKRNGIITRSHKEIKYSKTKPTKKIRPILFASHIDASIYSYYTHKKLSPIYEDYLRKKPKLSECISAYRRIKTDDNLSHKNNIHFAKDVFDEIKKREECIALAFDIESFFNNLNHKLIKQSWAKLLGRNNLPKDHYNLFRSVTNFSYIKMNDLRNSKKTFDEKSIAYNKNRGIHSYFFSFKDFLDSDIVIFKNQRKNKETKKIIGIPQGLPISAFLANLYLLSFDESIYKNLVEKKGCFYRRYSDDLIIVCEKNQMNEVIKVIESEIKKRDLTISIPKTERILFKNCTVGKIERLQSYEINNDDSLRFNIPLNYLGFEFYGYQTLIKSKNISRFYRDMKNSIKTKRKRTNQISEKLLIDSPPLHKRKLYRLYTHKGVKTQNLRIKINGVEVNRKYRGNFLRYVYKSSEIMNTKKIKRQLRNHWKILKEQIDKNSY